MKLSPEELRKIRDKLNKECGIFINDEKLEKIYKGKFEKLLQEKKICKEKLKQLETHKDILNELIQSATVNESYFLREEHHFKIIINYLIPEFLNEKVKTIKILSAPCSTGEEVYTLAILLLEEKELISSIDINLIGIDINPKVIDKARIGIFNKRSLYKLPEHLLNKYFIKVDNNHYQVKKFIRDAVTFEVANVLNFEELKPFRPVHIILSRNMLMYFDDASKRKTIENFYSILTSGGYLILGHADRMPKESETEKLFNKLKIEGEIIYKKL